MFIEIGISNILTSILSILIFFFVIIMFFEGLKPTFYFIKERYIPFLIFLFTCFFIGYLTTGILYKHSFKILSIIFGLMILIVFLSRLLSKRIKQKPNKVNNHKEQTRPTSAYDAFWFKFGWKFGPYILCLIIISILALFSGYISASIKTVYIVLPESKELVVLKSNKEYLVAAELDRNEKSVYSRFEIIPHNKGRMKLDYEYIGYLKPMDPYKEFKKNNEIKENSHNSIL